VRIVAVSTVYQTTAEGRPEEPFFYNCVVELETHSPPLELKSCVLRRIEWTLGRMRGQDKFAARTIDLDLILYDELVLSSEKLTLPDPEIARRPYLAVPLHELSPALVLPGWGTPISDIAARLAGSEMTPLKDYTERIRKEILHEWKQ
jgi:2-amino-4-hydroxy-6-hydroxymethyldihydropteridine diphosphokinase